MAETPNTTPPPQDMHWGIAYLREDIQDLRGGMVRLDAKIDARFGELDAKIDARFGELGAKIEARYGELDAKISRLDNRIDELHRVIRDQGSVLTQRMVMLTGLMTTVLLAAMKL